MVTVRTERLIASGPSKGICSRDESLDAEKIGVRIVLRNAAFPPKEPHWRLVGGKGLADR